MASKSYGWDVRNIGEISPKTARKQPFFDFFRFSQKLFIRFERNFLQLFYTILWSFMCNFIKFVWLRCENKGIPMVTAEAETSNTCTSVPLLSNIEPIITRRANQDRYVGKWYLQLSN